MAQVPQRFAGKLGFVQAQRVDVKRIGDQVIDDTHISGVVETQGVGEAVLDIKFPTWFVQKPTVSFGGELAANEYMEEGKFPTVSCVVVEWIMMKEDSHFGGFYAGARVAVVTTGRVEDSGGHGQVMNIHWQAVGKAMQNPTTPKGPM